MISSVFQKELGYAPCRDERCDLDYVHPEHDMKSRLAGPTPRTCPNCLAKVKARACVACGWQRPKKEPMLVTRRDETAEQVMRHTVVIRQVTSEDGAVIMTEYRCPSHNRGGCSGRGWRKYATKPCRVCLGAGSVRWTYDRMFDFLATPAYARPR